MKRLALLVVLLLVPAGLLMAQASNDIRWHRRSHATDPNVAALLLKGGTMTGTIGCENSGPCILIPTAADSNTIGPSIEFTPQGFEPAPWRMFMAEGGAGDHDHVLALSYNGEYTRNLGLVRDSTASHVVNWAWESRFTLGDPNTVRGRFEMNLDIDPNIGTSSVQVVRPYALHYNMDVGSRKTELAIGVPTDTASPFMTMNGGFSFWSIADKVTFGERNDAGGLTNDPNSQGRILLDPGSVASGTDRAAIIQNASDGALNLMPGLNTSGVAAPIWLGFGRSSPVVTGNISGAETAKFSVKGISDVVQTHIQGHSTQNGEILLVEENDGTDLIRVFNQGIYQANFREDTTEPTCSSGIYGLSANPTPATMRVCNNGVRGDIPSSLAGSGTLNFADPAADSCSADLTLTVTGAADGDVVSLGVPNGSVVAGGQFTAWVSGANTVTVRHCCVTAADCADPASGTFKARVDKP